MNDHGNSQQMIDCLDDMLSDHAHKDVGIEYIREQALDNSKIITVGMGGPPDTQRRPGVWLFYMMAEFTFYDPTNPEKEKLFQLMVLLWHNLVWSIGVFPRQHKDKLERLARRCQLRFANGVPQVWPLIGDWPTNVLATGHQRKLIVPNARTMFPLPSPNVFGLESADGATMTLKEDSDLCALWREKLANNSKFNYWPEIIGA